MKKRQFKVSKNMIYHTIENQAGSIEKALLECLMNAVDAGATKVEVDIDDDGVNYSVMDNGRGFQTEEEIEQCFDVFGFEHHEDDHRTYGTFGIGRAQLWAFSNNTWFTNEFELTVDIKNKGLDYDFKTNKKKNKGCKIVGTFYEKQSLMDIQSIKRELIKLAQYLPIKFLLNGKQVNKEVNKQKWDFETDEGYVKLNKTGDLLVYNKGVFVRAYPNWKFGTGGTVVSKDVFQLNTARNDILVGKCKVWRKLKKFLDNKTTERNLKSERLSSDQMNNLVHQFLFGELTYSDVEKNKIFIDIKGKPQSITYIKRNFKKKLTIADSRCSSSGESILMNKVAFVFSPQIIEFLNITKEEFINKINEKFSQWDKFSYVPFEDLEKTFNSTRELVDQKKLSKTQKVEVKTLDNISRLIYWTSKRVLKFNKSPRNIVLGNAEENILAWTDGSNYIALNKSFVKKQMKRGSRGLFKIVSVIVHEYCHGEASVEDHIHSPDFYEDYHDVMVNQIDELNDIVVNTMETYVKQLLKEGLSINKSLGVSLEKNKKVV